MRQRLPIGQSDFRNIIMERAYYIDKSLLIKEVINDDAVVLLLPRPRRFGKTVNLSMLRYFFEKTEQEGTYRDLFNGLAIEQEEEFQTHLGQYPVIFLTFKDVKQRTFEGAYASIKKLIAREFLRHKYLLEGRLLEINELESFSAIIESNASDIFFEDSLRDLCSYLYRYYQQPPVVLIDEYDTPIHTAYFEGYYQDMIAFFRSFFGAGFKDNPVLFKGVLTGILRVAKESIFSGMNNLGVYSLLSHKFSTRFGLTEDEVETLLADYGVSDRFQDVRRWYNGYIFGETTIYNPWSILNYVSNIRDGYKPYWANTASNQFLKELLVNSPSTVKLEFQDLLQAKPLQKALDENIVFGELQNNACALYSFLVFSGYLKAFQPEVHNDNTTYHLALPNVEVKKIFEDVIFSWLSESYENRNLQLLLKALIEQDIPTFEEILNDFVLTTLSYFDTQKQDVERVYQAFLLGLLVNLAPQYEIQSNKESGFGRYDISVIPKDVAKPAIIMELKRIGLNETKDSALANALKQIEEKRYDVAIRQRGIHDITTLAVTFDGKRVWVKTGDAIAKHENV